MKVFRPDIEESTAVRDNRKSDLASTGQSLKQAPPIAKSIMENQKAVRFCNKCGTILKKNDKVVACVQCGTTNHVRCVQKKGDTIDAKNYVCCDCCD